MSIHTSHPFLPEEGDRDPLRRLRGRMASPVTVWTAGEDRSRVGLTVSSVLVAAGEPARVIGLVDENSDLWEAGPRAVVVNVLGPDHAWLADAFAGQVPAPGGPFTLGEWDTSEWGPVLEASAGWLGVRLDESEPRRAGWSLVVEGTVEHVEIGTVEGLSHVRGRYRS